MHFTPREFLLKDGRAAILRSPVEGDAASDIRCLCKVFRETDFLLRTPDEVNPDVLLHAAALHSTADDPNTLLLFCIMDGEIVARLHGCVRPMRKARHRFHLGVSVMQAYWRLGIASAMMDAAEEAACVLGCTQIELEIMAGNIPARALYEKRGYRIVQVKPDAICLPDGTLTDEYLMNKKL